MRCLTYVCPHCYYTVRLPASVVQAEHRHPNLHMPYLMRPLSPTEEIFNNSAIYPKAKISKTAIRKIIDDAPKSIPPEDFLT